MKKIICICLAGLLLFSFSSCRSNSDYYDEPTNYGQDVETDVEEDYDDEPEDESEDEPEQENSDAITFISDRSLDYYNADNVFRLFFGLKNAAEEYVDSSGKVTVTMFDNNSNQLYKNTFDFDEKNFSSWSNKMWSESKYLCSVDIDRSQFKHCDSSSGVFSMYVELDNGTWFDESKYNFSGLPEHEWERATCTTAKKCATCGETSGEPEGHDYNYDGKCDCGAVDPKIEEGLSKCNLQLPSLPKSVSDYDYDDEIETTVTITDMSYEFECSSDGYIELRVKFSGEKTYDARGKGQSDSYPVGWKLYDASGNVFDTGTFYTPSVAVGESFVNKEDTLIYMMDEVEPGSFRLEILNSN